MTLNPLSHQFKVCLEKQLSEFISESIWIDDGCLQIGSIEKISVLLDSIATTICFSGFENAFYSFDYDSYETYATSICAFIKRLVTHKVRIVSEYKGKALSKSSIYFLDESSWMKIATNKLLGGHLLFGRRTKKIEEFYYK